MIILGIETSCDETALSLLDASGTLEAPKFKVISTALYSQVKIHEKYGGVFPMLAKREHQKNLVPLFLKLIKDSGLKLGKRADTKSEDIEKILEKEPELLVDFLKDIVKMEKPAIDAIAVTTGPGLEPALWVGVNFARALSELWDIPAVATNHMEGHLASVLLNRSDNSNLKSKISKVEFPVLGLLISGGHTELVRAENWGEYKVLGATRDDAIGEAFDKVARILGLPYPGGPEISRLAEEFRLDARRSTLDAVHLPRPMLHSDNYDFSFAGLKTAVLYLVKKLTHAEESHSLIRTNESMKGLSESEKKEIACEFENAVTEVLIEKTRKALEEFGAKTLIIAGGVVSNKHIRESFEKMIAADFPDTTLLMPEKELSTDNAVMIAAAGYLNILLKSPPRELKANGNWSIEK